MSGFVVPALSLLLFVGIVRSLLLRIEGMSEPVQPLGPDPRPPAFRVVPAPPYDWSIDGEAVTPER